MNEHQDQAPSGQSGRDSRRLAIGVVTVADLPEGSGRTARLRTLVGAVTGMGHQVVIWNEHSLEAAWLARAAGEVGGARYEYVLGTTKRKRGFRAINLKLSAVRTILERVRVAAGAGKLDLIVLNQLSFYDIFPITRLATQFGIPTIQCYEDERIELVGRKNISLARRVFGCNSWLADHWCSRKADQFWVISRYLQKKYAQLSGHPERVWLIPTIIDCAAWALGPEPSREIPIILYAGSFGDYEDMEKLAMALGCLKQWKVEFRMRFLGAEPSLPRVQQLRSLSRKLAIEEFLDFRGFRSAAVVRREIANANILVDLRNNSIWSRSGLATKLSEYLAAGRTVLTTDIGDNARYVEDGISALVVSPDDSAERLAHMLKAAIRKPEWRKKLGAGARQAALAHFHVSVVQEVIAKALSCLPLHPSRCR